MKKKEFYSLGIMSGSSVDGLDFSLIKSDGEKNVEIITNKFFEFEINFRQQVFMLIDEFNARSNKNHQRLPWGNISQMPRSNKKPNNCCGDFLIHLFKYILL